MCNEIERERDPQQQVFYQTIKASASRPSSAKSLGQAADATPRGSGGISHNSQKKNGSNCLEAGARFQGIPALAVENLDTDTTTYAVTIRIILNSFPPNAHASIVCCSLQHHRSRPPSPPQLPSSLQRSLFQRIAVIPVCGVHASLHAKRAGEQCHDTRVPLGACCRIQS